MTVRKVENSTVSRIEDLACDVAVRIAAECVERSRAIVESPIEMLMYAAFKMYSSVEHADRRPIAMFDCGGIDDLIDRSKRIRDVIHIAPQVDFEKYRVDFLAMIQSDRSAHFLVVECDGHEWHERSKEQAAADKERDRWFLVTHNISVMRFTGSEIWKDPMKCVSDVARYLSNESLFWESKMDSMFAEGWSACSEHMSKTKHHHEIDQNNILIN